MSCTVRATPPKPGESAFIAGNLSAAEPLLQEESKAPHEDGDRAHNALIRLHLRQGKLDPAAQDAASWLAQQPNSGWAKLSVAEVEWRKGEITESMRDIDAANRLAPCNAQVRYEYALAFEFSGLFATAKRSLDAAHRLDPNNDQITEAWLELQPRSARLENISSFLAANTTLSGAQRSSLERTKAQLAEPTSAAACRAVSTVASTTAPFYRIQNGPHAPIYDGLAVSFNGTQRRLEIDTGAHGLTLTRAAASALHLPVESKGLAGGIGDEGAVATSITTVKSLKIGALEFQNCQIEILEKTLAMGSSDGLIGGDVFADYLVTLDFPGRVLRLDPLPALPNASPGNTPALETGAPSEEPVRDRYIDPSMRDWASTFRSGHLLILPVHVNNGPTRLFILDSGAESNLISRQLAKEVGSVYSGSEFTVTGISGEVQETDTTGPLKLDFAGVSYPSPGMIAVDTGHFNNSAHVGVSGFLGAPILHQLTVQIDYRDNLVHMSFDPKRIQHCAEGVNISDCY